MAVIDVVMVAKKCSYEAAKKICQRLLKDHWDVDLENGRTEGTNLTPQFFRFIRLERGRNGGQATLCANAACIGEILILIPGCELSVQLRKDMVQCFLGKGGVVTFQSLLANPRIRGHLSGMVDNPLGEFLEDADFKLQVRGLPSALKLALRERDEQWTQIALTRDNDTKRVMVGMNEDLKQRDEDAKLMLVGMLEAMQLRRDAELRERDAALQTLLAAHGERQADVVKQLETSLLAALAARMFCGTEEKPQTTN